MVGIIVSASQWEKEHLKMAANNNLLSDLINIGVLKIGTFTLKSGVESPIYIDLRSIIAFPNILERIAKGVREKQVELGIQTDVICGVPYTALPIASVFSILNSVPMVIKRKEIKNYGTKKMVEGIFSKGAKCFIIEDIVSSGSSIIETAEVLRNEGLIITDCITVLDRMQGGRENLLKFGINLHALYNINELFEKYCLFNDVDSSLVNKINTYLEKSYIPVSKIRSSVVKSFNQRANLCKQPVLQRLFNIMSTKETNLCVSVDVVYSEELLRLAEKVGPYICILKTHVDILNDFSSDVVISLQSLASKFNFLIMEDRKFADIGNTVKHQYADGLYHIQSWADIVTVHGIPGSCQIEALKSVVHGEKRACILIAEMSSEGALTNDEYKSKIVEMAKKHPDFVIGFVSQHKLVADDNIIHMTPGVNISVQGDLLGQQYNLPDVAVNNGADVIIVGRGICNAKDVVEAVLNYKKIGYSAYQKLAISN